MGTMDYEHSKNEMKDWTIMVYLAGGSNVSDAARDSLCRMKEVGSTEKFNVIAQFDTGSEGSATKRYFLTKLEGALVADKVVSKIDTSSLGESLANLLLKKLPADHEYADLRDLDVTVASESRKLGPVLDEVLTSPEEKECFRKCLLNPTDRKNLVDDPAWLKTCILTCLLEKDRVPDFPEQATDTSDPTVLQNFIQWGSLNLKAKHRMVIIWGHGDGFSVAWDATAGSKIPGIRPRNSLRPSEFPNAFEVTPKVDIVGFNACLMGMIEVYHKLRGKVDYGITSEGYTPTTSWPFDKILSFLQNNPTVAPKDFAKTIVNDYWLLYDGSEVSKDEGIDLSACDIQKSEGVEDALGNLVKLIIKEIKVDKDGKLKRALVGARMDVQDYSHVREYVDLADFCDELMKKCTQEEVQDPIRDKINESCQNVISSIVGGMVLNSKDSGDRVKDSKGLSIYFPTDGDLNDYKDLAIGSLKWSDVLESYPDWANEIPKLFTLVRRASV